MLNVEQISNNILSWLIAFPLLSAFVILLIPEKNNGHLLKIAGFSAVILEFIFSLHLVCYFSPNTSHFQFSEMRSWLPSSTGINYILGVDGFSLILVILTTSLAALTMMTAWTTIHTRIKGFIALFLLLESAIIGTLVSLDVVLFYVFWEASLIPVYFMIGIWGGKDRIYATVKFFIYGAFGSLFMLVALIYLYHAHFLETGLYSSNLLELYQTASTLPVSVQGFLFLAVALAFGIKIPLFPVYTWLPDTYEQAPAVYTLMSGIILKLAAYGLVRLGICLFPVAASQYATPIMILAVIGILYGALIAWKQTNIRRVMAFSSLSHMGFIVLGLFSFNLIALQGSLYQMLNHAVTAGALFVLFNFLYDKRKSFELNAYGGLAKVLPWASFFFVLAAMGAVALPGTGNFVGEWMILMGSFQTSPVLASIATLGVITGPAYVLWFTYKILFGPIVHEENKKMHGLQKWEVAQLSILSICIFALGFGSNFVLKHTQNTLAHMEKTMVSHETYHALLLHIEGNKLVLLSSPKTPDFKSEVR